MKKLVIRLIFALIILGILLVSYYTRYSKNALMGRENRENIKKIEIGMKLSQVNEIMGSSETIAVVKRESSEFYGQKVLSYYRGPLIYGYLQVIVDAEVDTVIQIVDVVE